MADDIRCSVCNARVKAENETAHMRRVHPRIPLVARRGVGARPRRRLTSRDKKAIFVVVLVAIVILAGTMLLRSAETGAPRDTTATVVHVSMSGFEPSTITARAGTPLRIDLINGDNRYHTDGGGWHNFAIDEFSLNATVEPSGQAIFSVPTDGPGVYGWYCSMCCGGRANPAMNGRLVVQP